jgi:hypothetical protein
MEKDFALPSTMKIEGVEIFASGVWNGDKYTVGDLDEMVESFEKTKTQMKPYLKLGHTEKQKIAQADGLPSMGIVESLRRVGTKLVADFVNVPRAIYELIERGAYSRVSSEIFFNIDVMGKKFGKVLKAVALLGGDTPAVQNLKDIMALYTDQNLMTGGGLACYGEGATVSTYSIEKGSLSGDQEGTKMDSEQKKEMPVAEEKTLSDASEKKEVPAKGEGLDEMKKKLEELKKENADLKCELDGMKVKKNELEAKVLEYQDKSIREEVSHKVEALITEKKITPAQKEQAFTLIYEAKKDVSEKKYSIGEKEVSKEEYVLSFFSQNSVEVKTETETNVGETHTDEDKKIMNYAEKNKVSYRDAMLSLSDGDPK